MKLLFLIRNLGSGGAERQLVLLANNLSDKHQVFIMTFYDNDNFYLKDVSENIRYITLAKKGRWDTFSFFIKFYNEVSKLQPELIYAFMDSAEFLSFGYKIFNRKIKLVWGIRSSNMDLRNYDKMFYLLRRVECLLSPFSDLIISNSFSGRDFALQDGFLKKEISVIHNGINTTKFIPNSSVRKILLKDLNISENKFIIGIIARHDPMKGLDIFIAAAIKHLKSYPDTVFVVIGKECERYTKLLKEMVIAKIALNFKWIGAKTNIENYYNLMDIYTSSSVYGEGFSNTIGEAMSCGVPCVVTDIGDSKLIVGTCGLVINKCSPDEINNAWVKIRHLSLAERFKLGKNSRTRIIEHYSIEKMVRLTEDAFQAIL